MSHPIKWGLLFILLGVASSAGAQCANTSYGGGFTCVQMIGPSAGAPGTGVSILTVTLPANSTAGNGIIAVGSYCTTANCVSSTGPLAGISVTDGANDTGWQPCHLNGSSANSVRFWYCWWLPRVGTTTTFSIHAPPPYAYGLALWVAEIAGGCTTTMCIDSEATPVLCAGGSPCGVPITTVDTNIFVVGFGLLAGTSLTAAPGWKNIGGCAGAGCPIAALATVPGVYAPTWTTTSTPQMLAVGIESPNSVQPGISVPTLPVY